LPSTFGEQTIRPFIKEFQKAETVRKSKRAPGIIGNRIHRRTRMADRLDEFLGELELRRFTRPRDTQIYPTLAEKGLSLFDFHNQRGDNFKPVWRPLLSFIDGSGKQQKI
jgi:chromosome partitioning protein